MKTTKYLLYALPALMLTACASDEPTDGGAGADGAAVVRADIGALLSRASGTQWDAADCIGISGITGAVTYTNVPYVTADGDGSFAPLNGVANGIFFQDGRTATFSAYYPYSAEVTAENNVIKGSTIDQKEAKSFDFLYASGAKGSLKEPALNFTDEAAFTHSMAQLVINITADNQAGFNGNLVLNEGEVSLSGIALEGEFDTSTGIASATGNAATHSLSDNAEMTLTGNSASLTLIYFPQTVSNVKLSIEYEGNTYLCSLSPTLAAGKRFTANVNLKKTGLSVSNASITDWVDNGSSNDDVTIQDPNIKVINGHEAMLMRAASGTPGSDDYVPALYVATCNIGADAPADTGLYFQWGMTEGHPADGSYCFERYYHVNGKNAQELYDEGYVTTSYQWTAELTPEHDAATANWGEGWKMPNQNELKWLSNNAVWAFSQQSYNGTVINGCSVVSRETGAEIFLPMAGRVDLDDWLGFGNEGCWPSSSYGGLSSIDTFYALKIFYLDSDLVRDKFSFISSAYVRKAAYTVRPVAVM